MIPRVVKWGTALTLAIICGVSIYGFYLYRQIRSQAVMDEANQADAIVVLGAAQYNGRPSPVLKARLDHERRPASREVIRSADSSENAVNDWQSQQLSRNE